MNKAKAFICIALASMALTACSNGDNPVLPINDPTVVNVDDPQEEVTDQPASVRE